MPLYAAYERGGSSSESDPERRGKRPLAEVDRAPPDNPSGGVDDNAEAGAAEEEGQPRQSGVLALPNFATACDPTRSHQRVDILGRDPETLCNRLRVHNRRTTERPITEPSWGF